MTAARYKAELAALAVDTCERCNVEYPTTELARCAWCDGIFCRCCFYEELNCCKPPRSRAYLPPPTCLYQAANRLRELRDAAITVLNATNPLTWQWNLSTALEILQGKEKT